ncbi:MAG: sugar MFS transporter [Bacteroidales bacterium]|nr:sugar MFS transporter [Candidatus Colimorpha merdihippi]MCQ2283051.1 sugar MFS transporter [Bacteroidales bacterium]
MNKKIVGKQYLMPFILIASLFFFWGFAHSILDILNKHFQEGFEITKTKSALVQCMVYGGYFIMALPAGRIIRKWGYKAGVIVGLLLYGIGALLFIPGEHLMSFEFFLVCLFIIGCGLTCLETSANPYVTVLGDNDSSASRLNLAQSLNGLGWIVGPLVGSLVVFSGEDGNSGSVALPYAVIGVVVLVIAAVFGRMKLPEIVDADEKSQSEGLSLWKSGIFVFGMIALFFYVAAQTGVNSFFINYVTENTDLSNKTAGLLLSFGGMGLFLIGRLLGSWVMNYLKAERLLLGCAIGSVLCMCVVIFGTGMPALVALVLNYLCESIMFPTIFAIALRGLDAQNTKKGSSYLIMTIVGGAVAPVLMGALGEANMAVGFIIPLVCYMVVAAFSFRATKQSV